MHVRIFGLELLRGLQLGDSLIDLTQLKKHAPEPDVRIGQPGVELNRTTEMLHRLLRQFPHPQELTLQVERASER